MNRALSIVGLLGTVGYIALVYALVGDRLVTLSNLPLNEFGDFLAGAFGPLAIFWLVLGFFQQGRELQLNTQALELQAEELKSSVEQQRELVAVTRQQVEAELQSIADERERISRAAKASFSAKDVGVASARELRYRLHITNAGADAASVWFASEPALPNLSPEQFPFWPRGHQNKIEWNLKRDEYPSPIIIRINYTDVLGLNSSAKITLENQPGTYNYTVSKVEDES